MMGLIGMGNNPMVGATVALSVLVVQTLAEQHTFFKISDILMDVFFYKLNTFS